MVKIIAQQRPYETVMTEYKRTLANYNTIMHQLAGVVEPNLRAAESGRKIPFLHEQVDISKRLEWVKGRLDGLEFVLNLPNDEKTRILQEIVNNPEPYLQ